MRRPALLALAVALLTAAVLLAAHWGSASLAMDPSPSPLNPDPAGTLALQMLLRRRGVPAVVARGLPEGAGATVLWFTNAPGVYGEEELESVREWVRSGGHLVLVCSARSASRTVPFLRDFGVNFQPEPLGEPAPVRALPYEQIAARPSAFDLGGGSLRVRGLGADGRPFWVSGQLGSGTWDALADSFPFENAGLGEGGNAHFALGMLGERVFMDASLLRPPPPPTLGEEPLVWATLLQGLLLGGTLLLSLRRLGPPLVERPRSGTLRLRAGLTSILARREDARELLDLEAEVSGWTAPEREGTMEAAGRGDWTAAYRRVGTRGWRPPGRPKG